MTIPPNGGTSPAAPRRLTASFALAAIVAAIACAVPLAAAFVLILARPAGLSFGYGVYADLVLVFLGNVVDGELEWQHVVICVGRTGGEWVYDSHTGALHRDPQH